MQVVDQNPEDGLCNIGPPASKPKVGKKKLIHDKKEKNSHKEEKELPAWQQPYVPLRRLKRSSVASLNSDTEDSPADGPGQEGWSQNSGGERDACEHEDQNGKVHDANKEEISKDQNEVGKEEGVRRKGSMEDGKVGDSILRKHSTGSVSDSPRMKKRVSFEDQTIPSRRRSASWGRISTSEDKDVNDNIALKAGRKYSVEEGRPRKLSLRILRVEKMSDDSLDDRSDEVLDRQCSTDSILSNDVFSRENSVENKIDDKKDKAEATPESSNAKKEIVQRALKEDLHVGIRRLSEAEVRSKRSSSLSKAISEEKERTVVRLNSVEKPRSQSMCPLTAFNLR